MMEKLALHLFNGIAFCIHPTVMSLVAYPYLMSSYFCLWMLDLRALRAEPFSLRVRCVHWLASAAHAYIEDPVIDSLGYCPTYCFQVDYRTLSALVVWRPLFMCLLFVRVHCTLIAWGFQVTWEWLSGYTTDWANQTWFLDFSIWNYDLFHGCTLSLYCFKWSWNELLTFYHVSSDFREWNLFVMLMNIVLLLQFVFEI